MAYTLWERELSDTLEFINENISDTDNYNGKELINILQENEGIPGPNEYERNRASIFYNEHKDCCRNKLGKEFFSSTGGGFSILVSWTPIGFIYNERCNSCKELCDITDYSKFKDKDISLLNIRPFTFEITGTGLGNITIVHCNSNKNSKDVTDSDCW